MSIVRSSALVFVNIHPCSPAASPAIATKHMKTIHETCSQVAPAGSFKSTPAPSGSSTKKNGTTNAGIVYFHACSVVLYGSPPAIAAAAKGERALRADTPQTPAPHNMTHRPPTETHPRQ